MTDYISRAITNILDTLKEEVEDPLHRTDRDWIYYGAYDEKAKTPVVYFIWEKEFPGDMHLGSVSQPHNMVLRMYVMVRAGTRGTLEGVEYKGTKLLNRVYDKVMNVLESKSLTITGVDSIIRAPTNRGVFDYDPISKINFSRTYFNVFIWRSE